MPTSKTKTQPKSAAPVIPDDELMDLTEENFLAVMQKLGGKDVSTAQMLPYFKIREDPKPANRWLKLRAMAKKLVKVEPPKVIIEYKADIREYRYALP